MGSVWVVTFLAKFGVSAIQFIFLNGVFEVLVGLSLVTGFFEDFSLLAMLPSSIFIFIGINEVTVRDFGLSADCWLYFCRIAIDHYGRTINSQSIVIWSSVMDIFSRACRDCDRSFRAFKEGKSART